MKFLLLCCLLPAGGFAQPLQAVSVDSTERTSAWIDDVFTSYSLDYHYQGFHGIEAAMHLTCYYLRANHLEYGAFFGTDLNFTSGFNVVAPTFGLETSSLFFNISGMGLSAKLRGTIYSRGTNAYLIFAPEIAWSYLSIVDLFYSWNYSPRSFEDWNPHRFGIRFTFGNERTIFNIFDMTGI